MTMYEYLELIKKVDPEFRSLFVNLTKHEFMDWDVKTYSMMNHLVDNTKYKDVVDANKTLKVLLFSEPCVWLLFIKDEDFLLYLDGIWSSIKELIINGVDEMKHFIEVITILHNRNPERFPID